MKKTLILLGFIVFTLSLFAQKGKVKNVALGSEEYRELKSSGELNSLLVEKGVKIVQPNNFLLKKKDTNNHFIPQAKKKTSTCYGYFPPNVAPQDSLGDDQSILVNIPFDFCFYGSTYNSLYINDNGTVSFTVPHGAFTAQGFPFSSALPGEADEIIAPFWADFNQAGINSGRIYFEVLSNAIVIHWENVGYYNAHDDKLNTMMLVLSDGTSSLIQPGSNVGFFYDDMQWTTGDASFGVNGFGGTAATVGANKGDGINYVQFGRFDEAGSAYDGPFGAEDGVSWLDNKSFMFNICNSNNIPPIVVGIDFCDTLRLCVGDTLPINVSFLAPEAGQLTWAEVDSSQSSGFHMTNYVSGINPTAQIDGIFIGDTSNTGVNILTFTAFDNGSPADTIEFDYIIIVDTLPLIPVIVGDTSYCEGNVVVLDAGNGFDAYLWSNDSTNQTTTVTQGAYAVQAFIGGCSFTTDSFYVAEYTSPFLEIIGDTIYCEGDSSLLSATPGFESYLWNTNASDTLDSLFVTQGSYSVTITDTNSCTWGSNTLYVYDFANTVSISGDTTYCLGETVTLSAGLNYDSYLWNGNTNDTLDSLVVTAGDYFVTVTQNGCEATDSISVLLNPVPVPNFNDTGYCAGSFMILNGDPLGVNYDSYSWNTTPVQAGAVASLPPGTYQLSVTLNGCPAVSQPFTVTENPLPDPNILGDYHYCSNDSNGTTLSTSEIYSAYNWNSNASNNSSYFATVGQTILIVTDSNNCNSFPKQVNISESSPEIVFFPYDDFCPGQTTVLKVGGGFDSYLWDSGEITQLIDATGGSHTITITDVHGCQDDSTIILTPLPAPTADFTISPLDYQEPNLPVVFTNNTSFSNGSITGFNWDFDFYGIGSPNIPFSNSATNNVEYSTQGTYTISLIVEADNGCSDTIVKEYLIVDKIVASTVMTPNGDLKNDNLVFRNLWYYPNNKLSVFSRWGNIIFEQENYQNDWNGNNHPVGTYFYILEVESLETPLKGSFTILE